MDKSGRMSLRLGDVEQEIVKGLAQGLDVTDSEAVRLAIRWIAGRVPHEVMHRVETGPVPKEVVELQEALLAVVTEIRRVGVNLNQVVRLYHVNGWDDSSHAEVLAMPSHVDELVRVVSEAVANVGD